MLWLALAQYPRQPLKSVNWKSSNMILTQGLFLAATFKRLRNNICRVARATVKKLHAPCFDFYNFGLRRQFRQPPQRQIEAQTTQ